MKITKFMFLLLACSALVPSESSWAIELLAGMKNFHVVWIGSPLRENQYERVKQLCDQLQLANKEHPTDRLEKLVVWHDAEMLKAKNQTFFQNSKNGREALDPNCKGLLELRDVSELFQEEHCKEEDVVKNLTASEFYLKLLSEPAISCNLGPALTPQEYPQLPKMCLEEEFKDLNQHYAQLKRAYRFLQSKMKDLGGTAFAPMADLLRILAVHKMGGIYMDINKDFTKMGFKWDRSQDGEIRNCDSIVVAPELPYFNVPEKAIVPPSASNIGATPWVGSIPAQFFKESVQGSRKFYPHSYRGFHGFTNNDFFAASCPKSKPVTDLLKEVSRGYQSLLDNPALSVFMNSEYFSSMPWVWSVGGPTRLSSVLAKSDPKKVIRAEQLSSYEGALSWLRFPSKSWGSVLLGKCLKQSSSPVIQQIERACHENNTYDTLRQGRTNNDLDSCFFDYLLEAVEKNKVSKDDLQSLNRLSTDFDNRFKKFEAEMKNQCKEAIAKLGDTSTHPIDVAPDPMKENILCLQDSQAKLDQMNEVLKYPSEYDMALRALPPGTPPSPPPHFDPVLTKARVSLSKINFEPLCGN